MTPTGQQRRRCAPTIVVVGGGIAGLAAAWHLARAAAGRVCLLEREPLLATHASGRNAAIFRHLDHDAEGVTLALRSRALFADLEAPEGGFLRRTGTLFLGTAAHLRPLAELAQRFGLSAEALDKEAAGCRVPGLAGGDAAHGLFVPDDGVLDAHALVDALERGARAAGAKIRTDSPRLPRHRPGGAARPACCTWRPALQPPGCAGPGRACGPSLPTGAS